MNEVKLVQLSIWAQVVAESGTRTSIKRVKIRDTTIDSFWWYGSTRTCLLLASKHGIRQLSLKKEIALGLAWIFRDRGFRQL